MLTTASADVSKLHISSGMPAHAAPEPSSADTSRHTSASGQQSRPLDEYELERDLRAACDALDASEQAQPKLHLVVLGHVDAGKSTLMGRLLHDLGSALVQKLDCNLHHDSHDAHMYI